MGTSDGPAIIVGDAGGALGATELAVGAGTVGVGDVRGLEPGSAEQPMAIDNTTTLAIVSRVAAIPELAPLASRAWTRLRGSRLRTMDQMRYPLSTVGSGSSSRR